MSMETTIAKLVDASNELTRVVARKVSEIDLKVKAATEAVPTLVRGLTSQSFFVDAVEGSDTNDGSFDRPLKTASAAQAKIMNGSETVIYFKKAQVHDVQILMRAGRLLLLTYGHTNIHDPADLATIRPVLGGMQGELRLTEGPCVMSGQIFLHGLNIVSDVFSTTPLESTASFIRYHDSHLAVFMHYCNITLGNIPFATTYSGYSARDIYMSETKITVKAGFESVAKILKNLNGTEPTVRIEAHSTSLVNAPGGWASLLPAKGAGNYFTNIAI